MSTAATHREIVVDELQSALTDSSLVFLTSRDIANDTELSPSQVGKTLFNLSNDEDAPVAVQKWGNNGRATRWQVTETTDGPDVRADGGTAAPPTGQTAGGQPPTGVSKFQYDCLLAAAAHDRDPKGLAIRDRLQEWYGEQVNHARVYPNLDELVERGYLAKRARDQRTNAYRVTRAGRDLLRERASAFEAALGGGEQ